MFNLVVKIKEITLLHLKFTNFLSILIVENFQVFARWVVQGWTCAIKRSFLLVKVWTATHASPKKTLHFLEFIPGFRFLGVTLIFFCYTCASLSHQKGATRLLSNFWKFSASLFQFENLTNHDVTTSNSPNY